MRGNHEVASSCPRCSEVAMLLATFPGTDADRLVRPKGPDDSFCIKAKDIAQVASVVLALSDVERYFMAPKFWRAGTLRWSAWAIVVSDRGVYVQGSAGPLHRLASGGNLVPSEAIPRH
jgi:hypothetical protein